MAHAIRAHQAKAGLLILQVKWPKRPVSKLETALKGSYLVSTVVHRVENAEGELVKERLIGLIRCTSDRVFNATIWTSLWTPSTRQASMECCRSSLPNADLCMFGVPHHRECNDLSRMLCAQGKGIGRYMVVRTVEALKSEQIGNICLFADTEGMCDVSLSK